MSRSYRKQGDDKIEVVGVRIGCAGTERGSLRRRIARGEEFRTQNCNDCPGDFILRGLYLIERRGPGVAQAAEYFTQAVAKDSGFARAYAGLALALEFFPYFAGVPPERIEARARGAASRGLQLDPRLAEPRVALAMADWHSNRWNDAEAEFRRAIHTARAYAYAATRDTARVLSEMEAGMASGEMLAQEMLFSDRILDPIRLSARFAEIVRKARLDGRGLTGPTGNRPAP